MKRTLTVLATATAVVAAFAGTASATSIGYAAPAAFPGGSFHGGSFNHGSLQGATFNHGSFGHGSLARVYRPLDIKAGW